MPKAKLSWDARLFRRAPIVSALLSLCWLAQISPAVAQPPGRGKILFLRCASCHDVSPSASPKIGPNLHGVVGRRAGSLAGYDYSPALKSQTFVWDDAHLDRWLTNPSDLVPGTAMAFGGLTSETDRAAIIAYLRKAAD